MAQQDWTDDVSRSMSRRDFVARLAAVGGGIVLAGTSACGSGSANDGGIVTPPPETGNISGLVSSLDGTPQPRLGTLILMTARGRQTGARSSPDASGRFAFAGVTPGDYQIRFDAPGLAVVPEPFPHPIRFSVEAGKTTDVPVRVQLGNYNQNLVEIYIGDGFFQLQPNGTENGECVVKVGTNVCWYNVDTAVHTVSGGPWGDSGDLQKSQAYLWPATTTGLFGYQCRYHASSEKALLRVIP
jgi:carboxypeptidase family protein